MKDTQHLTFRPIRPDTDSNVKVHAFSCVLALMLCNVLNREWELMGRRMSVNHMIDILNPVKEIKVTFVISDKKPSIKHPSAIRKVLPSSILKDTSS
jgi:transposase